ncbi:MAG: flagellin [Planctomycetes bacterium]|nr:flagellin [Planctomycetota bacterium]NOG53510.1 flagellin [Planctomycetota bacterium]
MARINTNVPSLISQANLNRAYSNLNLRLERLSTGLRINRGSDDPAGLIASERLRSELAGLRKAISNSERATSVIATAEGALAEVADLLNSIKGLVVEAANTGGMSEEEIEANQLQIDSAIESITRISNTTNFAGLQLLNGGLDYLTSAVTSSQISKTKIFSAFFGSNSYIPVDVEVISSAQTAQIQLTANYGTAADGTLLSSVTLEIAGNDGVQVLAFTSGTPVSTVVDAVNRIKDSTGVSATLTDITDMTSGITLNSTTFGSDSFVRVKRISDSGDFFESQLSNERDVGQDVTAVVNGALATGDGLSLAIKTPTLNLELLLDSTFAQQTTTDSTFYITGGGAQFQIGPEVQFNQQINVGLSSVAASRLGGTQLGSQLNFLNSLMTGGDNNVTTANLDNASSIVDTAIDEISVLRGQLGAMERNTLQTNMRSMQVALENVTSSESKIRDADFAYETSQLTRAQIMVQAGTTVLATANANAQSVLQLLG